METPLSKCDAPDNLSLMGREEMIQRLLDFNSYSTFQFTRAWLRKQRTGRLRTLLLSAHRQGGLNDG